MSEYFYDLWSKGKTLGKIKANEALRGKYVIIPVQTDKGHELIKLPLKMIMVKDDGIEIVFKVVIDASHKSDRQKALLIAKCST